MSRFIYFSVNNFLHFVQVENNKLIGAVFLCLDSFVLIGCLWFVFFSRTVASMQCEMRANLARSKSCLQLFCIQSIAKSPLLWVSGLSRHYFQLNWANTEQTNKHATNKIRAHTLISNQSLFANGNYYFDLVIYFGKSTVQQIKILIKANVHKMF